MANTPYGRRRGGAPDEVFWCVGVIAIGYGVIKLSIWLTTGDWLL